MKREQLLAMGVLICKPFYSLTRLKDTLRELWVETLLPERKLLRLIQVTQ